MEDVNTFPFNEKTINIQSRLQVIPVLRDNTEKSIFIDLETTSFGNAKQYLVVQI